MDAGIEFYDDILIKTLADIAAAYTRYRIYDRQIELVVRGQPSRGAARGGDHERAAHGSHQRARALRLSEGRTRALALATGQSHRRVAAL